MGSIGLPELIILIVFGITIWLWIKRFRLRRRSDVAPAASMPLEREGRPSATLAPANGPSPAVNVQPDTPEERVTVKNVPAPAPAMDLIDRLDSLKSAWGALSCTSVLFPGATYLFDLASTKASPLGQFYPATGIPLGAMALLIAIVSSSDRRASKARSYSMVGAIIVALMSMMGFVLLASARQESVTFRGPGQCSFYFGGNQGDGYETNITVASGRITEVKTPCDCEHSGTLSWTNCKRTGPDVVSVRTHPDEYPALAMFDLSIICLTVSFFMISHELRLKHQAGSAAASTP